MFFVALWLIGMNVSQWKVKVTIWQFLPKGRKRRFKIESVRLGWAGLSWTVWYLQLTFLTIPFILSVFQILCTDRGTLGQTKYIWILKRSLRLLKTPYNTSLFPTLPPPAYYTASVECVQIGSFLSPTEAWWKTSWNHVKPHQNRRQKNLYFRSN